MCGINQSGYFKHSAEEPPESNRGLFVWGAGVCGGLDCMLGEVEQNGLSVFAVCCGMVQEQIHENNLNICTNQASSSWRVRSCHGNSHIDQHALPVVWVWQYPADCLGFCWWVLASWTVFSGLSIDEAAEGAGPKDETTPLLTSDTGRTSFKSLKVVLIIQLLCDLGELFSVCVRAHTHKKEAGSKTH